MHEPWSFILNSKVSNRIIAKLLRRYENYILRRRSTIFIVLAKQLTVRARVAPCKIMEFYNALFMSFTLDACPQEPVAIAYVGP